MVDPDKSKDKYSKKKKRESGAGQRRHDTAEPHHTTKRTTSLNEHTCHRDKNTKEHK